MSARNQWYLYREIAYRNLHLPRRGVYKAILALTWRCRGRCVMSSIWKRPPGEELSLSEWRTFFCNSPGLLWITLTGGEPFLRQDFVEIVRSAVAYLPRLYCINIATSGLVPQAARDSLRSILESSSLPRLILTISVDGPAEIHDRVRGVKGAFDMAREVIQEAVALRADFPDRFAFMLEHCLLPYNVGHFREMLDEVRRIVPGLTSHDFVITLPNVSAHYYGNVDQKRELMGSEFRLALVEAVREILRIRSEQGRPRRPDQILAHLYLLYAEEYIRSKKPPLPCRAARSTVFVNPQGMVFPCNAFNHPMGKLRDNQYDLNQIVANSQAAGILERIDRLECGGCWTPCEASVALSEQVLRRCVWRNVARTLLRQSDENKDQR